MKSTRCSSWKSSDNFELSGRHQFFCTQQVQYVPALCIVQKSQRCYSKQFKFNPADEKMHIVASKRGYLLCRECQNSYRQVDIAKGVGKKTNKNLTNLQGRRKIIMNAVFVPQPASNLDSWSMLHAKRLLKQPQTDWRPAHAQNFHNGIWVGTHPFTHKWDCDFRQGSIL